MLRSPDNLVLKFKPEINKIIAVAGNPYEKIAVIVRCALGIAQGPGVNNVKLNMVSIESEIGPD